MKPKVLLIVLLVLVGLFVFSTVRSIRSTSGRPGGFPLDSDSHSLEWISDSLAQPVKADEISLPNSDRLPGCSLTGNHMGVPPGKTCRFDILLAKRHFWQVNSTQRLMLRLVNEGGKVQASLKCLTCQDQDKKLDQKTQEAALQGPPASPETASPPPGSLTPIPPSATPRPTTTPVPFTIYAPDTNEHQWQLTLNGCEAGGGEICLVELAP